MLAAEHPDHPLVLPADDRRAPAALAVVGRSGQPLIVVGDSRAALRHVPADCVRCCVTSPPYWSLRDYRIPGQIGLEAQLTDYFGSLVAVFEEVRRVLTPDGTLWLNIGDSYTSGGRMSSLWMMGCGGRSPGHPPLLNQRMPSTRGGSSETHRPDRWPRDR